MVKYDYNKCIEEFLGLIVFSIWYFAWIVIIFLSEKTLFNHCVGIGPYEAID